VISRKLDKSRIKPIGLFFRRNWRPPFYISKNSLHWNAQKRCSCAKRTLFICSCSKALRCG